MNSIATKLSLGSVQFGIDYGISNKLGQVSEKTVAVILKRQKNQALIQLILQSLMARARRFWVT